jgi:hypothetical protein
MDKKLITIGIGCGAFSLECGDIYVHIDQEDDPAELLAEFFEVLGYDVEFSENY